MEKDPVKGTQASGKRQRSLGCFPLISQGKTSPLRCGAVQHCPALSQPDRYMDWDGGWGDTPSSLHHRPGLPRGLLEEAQAGEAQRDSTRLEPSRKGQGRAQGGTHAHVTRSHRSSRPSITCLVLLTLLADDSSGSLGRVEAAPGLSPPASLERKHPPHPSPPLASIPPIPLLQPTLPSSTADPCKTPAPILTPKNRWGTAPGTLSVGHTLAAPRPHWHHHEPAVPGIPVPSLLPHTNPAPCAGSCTDADSD